ncbi:GNAT family N-acetyltransferase [Alkalihalobacterium sp. APHAB7]|uniref:GNAT family N-acetyltransferase n=1 Tax=Alkalihalobacterium sp. APHAB7 TaxID=3402081 RepID=UPI003AB05DAF
MCITLEGVLETEKHILRNLYSLYLHDLSKFTSFIDIGADGFFEYEDLEKFWEVDGISPYFIKKEKSIIGFILLLERPFLKKDKDFGINDLFILNKYKGKGFGKQALEKLFQEKQGEYFVIELVENAPAVCFWKKIYTDFNIHFEEKEDIIDDEPCLIQTFKIS